MVSYSQDMMLCGSSLDESCGSWSPFIRSGSANLDLESFVQITGANGTGYFHTNVTSTYLNGVSDTRTQHTNSEFLFTWTVPDYQGAPPTGGVTSYGIAYRVGLLPNPLLWSFNGSTITTGGGQCSQGWANLTGTCLQGTGCADTHIFPMLNLLFSLHFTTRGVQYPIARIYKATHNGCQLWRSHRCCLPGHQSGSNYYSSFFPRIFS